MTVVATRQRSPFQRVGAAATLHLVNKWTYIGIPWLIMGIATVFSLAVTLLITVASGPDSEGLDGMSYSWAVLSPFWYMTVVGVMATASTLPFALSLTLTRKEFYLGTSIAFVGMALANGIGFTILTELEKLTSGWVLGMHMFTALWFGVEPWYVNLLSYFALQVVTMFVGASVAAVYTRWRINGMLVFWIGVGVLLIVAIAIVVLTGAGPALEAWLSGIGAAGIFGIVVAVAALAGVAGFFVIRRTTLRNT